MHQRGKVEDSVDNRLQPPISTNTIPLISPKIGRASASAVNDLPVELLSHIFEFGGGRSEDEDDKGDVPQIWDGNAFYLIDAQDPVGKRPYISFRIAISLVCHHWYRVALSTPSLWTTLRLASWDSFERLQTILARSRDLPLHIDAKYYIEDEPDNVEPYRLETEDEYLKYRDLLEERYITLFRSLAPRLRRLHFCQSRLDWSDPWIWSLSNLTSLELEHADEDVRPSWPQLISMLRSAPALKKLVIRSAAPWDGDDWHTSNVSDGIGKPDNPLPVLNLKDLVLADESPECVCRLITSLYMPALQSLSLDLDFIPWGNYTTFVELLALPTHVPATAPPPAEGQYTLLNRLEHLRIVSLFLGDNTGMLEILYDGLQNLKSLQLWLSDTGTKKRRDLRHLRLLLPYTSPGEGNTMVRLPRLETLTLCGYRGTIIRIRDLVEKRKDAGFPLKSLYVQRSHEEELRWLRENLETFSMF